MSYLSQYKEAPLKLVFMMEGAEESASVDLEKYLAKYVTDFQGADLLIWEQGIRNEQDQLELIGGIKRF